MTLKISFKRFLILLTTVQTLITEFKYQKQKEKLLKYVQS